MVVRTMKRRVTEAAMDFGLFEIRDDEDKMRLLTRE
jgi:hypothetical protein